MSARVHGPFVAIVDLGGQPGFCKLVARMQPALAVDALLSNPSFGGRGMRCPSMSQYGCRGDEIASLQKRGILSWPE